MRTRSFKLVLILLTSAPSGESHPLLRHLPRALTRLSWRRNPLKWVETAKPADAVRGGETAEGTATVQRLNRPAPAASRNKEPCLSDFPDEDIRTILRNVADLFELNLVVPAALQGRHPSSFTT